MSLKSLLYRINQKASCSETELGKSCWSYHIMSHRMLRNDQLLCNECESVITVLYKI